MIANQSFLFLIFTLDGAIIGLMFDIFRILRKSFKTSNIITYFEDMIFWIATGLLILFSMFYFNNGEIRFYMFLGIGIGIFLYILVISQHFIKINVLIINFIKNTTKKIIKLLKK